MFTERYAVKLTAVLWSRIAEMMQEDCDCDVGLGSIFNYKDASTKSIDFHIPYLTFDCSLCTYIGLGTTYPRLTCHECPLLELWTREGYYYPLETKRSAPCEDNVNSPYYILYDMGSDTYDEEDYLEAAMDIRDAAFEAYQWWVNIKEMNEA